MEQFKRYLLTLNIFEEPSGSPQEVNENLFEQRTQVVATRVYFLLLIVILFIFLFITCSTPNTTTDTIANPTLAQIQSLPINRICPCTRTSFSYDKFVSSNVSFHQVCSSNFVSDRWISSLFHGINASYFLPNDIRSIGFAEFQALASFCRLSQASAKQVLVQFGSSPFISFYFDSSLQDLHTKVMTTFNRFNSLMSTAFTSQIELISTIIISNNLLNALGTSIIPNKNLRTIRNEDKPVEYETLRYRHNSYAADCKCVQAETLRNEECRGPSGIYEEFFDVDTIHASIGSDKDPTILIPEFAASCMPVDACLLSSLKCFFNQSCVNDILLYQRMTDGMMWNFTALESDKALKPSHFNINSRIKSIVDKLMVEEWLIQEDYDKYFQQCAPVLCTYQKNIYPDFLDVLIIFIGLLGGLCSLLRLVVLPVVRFIRRRLWPPPMNTQPSQISRISAICRWCQQIPSMLKRFLIELNLFKINLTDDNNDQSQVRYQRIATRLYIGLLALSFAILTIYLALIRQIYMKTIQISTQDEFSHYYSLYNRSSLQCACSNISFPYNTFLTIEPQYHQMCSSDLFFPASLQILLDVAHIAIRHDIPSDYGQNAGSQFILLKKLCNETERTVTTSLRRFLNQTFITSQLVSKGIFEQQINTLIEEWKAFTINSFLRTLWLIRDIQYGNHLVAARSNSDLNVSETSSTFILNASIFYEECNCMSSPVCLSTMKVRATIGSMISKQNSYYVPGFLMGCFRLKALLNSTLETFYNQTFVEIMNSNLTKGHPLFKINFTALDASRNLPNETIDSVVSKLFVEDWSQKISFSNYFTACRAQSCTYTYDRQNLISLVTSVISIFGGLSTGLQIVFLILLWLVTKIMRSNISSRGIRAWLHIRLIKKQHMIRGLHIIFVATTLTTLYFTSTFVPQTIIGQIDNPVLEKYEELLADYPDTLQCPCVQISIPYKLFMNATVSRQHQVCSSLFIKDEWIKTLPLPEPQSSHSPMNFNKTAISFFQLLASLCELTDRHLTIEISDLMTRNVINTDVISRLQLNEQIKPIIDQFELNTQFSFLTTLQLIRAMTSDNHIMTVFETNWKWMPPHPNTRGYWGEILHTKPIVYNGSCNCGLSSQCVEESSTMPGLMVGCYPLESLLKSTLQCLYNSSCISLLQSPSQSFAPLIHSSSSRYQKNSTVEFILNQLMVDEWNKTIEYEKYYNQCAPSLCSYSYVDRRPTLKVLTLLLELYGGLIIIMNVIALLLAVLWQNILIIYRRRAQVQPT